jgi:hypothetical protein
VVSPEDIKRKYTPLQTKIIVAPPYHFLNFVKQCTWVVPYALAREGITFREVDAERGFRFLDLKLQLYEN